MAFIENKTRERCRRILRQRSLVLGEKEEKKNALLLACDGKSNFGAVQFRLYMFLVCQDRSSVSTG